MILSLLIILLITFSGTILTYLYEKEDSLLVRICAGNVIGSTFFGLIAFLLACLIGLSMTSLMIALVLTLLPLILFAQKETKQLFIGNLQKARGKFEGVTFGKFAVFVYYASIFLILCIFFDRAMIETKDGIFTGGSNNLGDLPFHLGAIFSFTDGNNFPPQNPSFAGAKFTYPFMADFLVACLMKFGANVRDAMFFQNITLGFSLFVLLEKFTFALTKNRLAGKFAPWLLLFSGGLGFAIFFRDYWQDGRGLTEFLMNLDKDYTIKPETLRWGNPMIVLFITQRAFLLGMPIVVIVLTYLWGIFNAKTQRSQDAKEDTKNEETVGEFFRNSLPLIFLGLLAGMLPLIHVHSLFALFIVCAFLVLFDLKNFRTYLIFGMAVSLLAVPELFWSLTGSATNLDKFIGWHFGWDKGKENFFLFWLKNLGFFIPLLLVALFLMLKRTDTESQKEEPDSQLLTPNSLLLFYMPFFFIFLLTNTIKLAPWEWDNIKVLIYWFLASIPFVAWLLAWMWQKSLFFKTLAVVSFTVLILSGAIDVWRVMSKQINYQIFNNDSIKIAQEIKQKTEPNALFLNAPTYNSAVVLTGRLSLMRYIGHLASYGIDYEPRERELMRIYEGSALADSLLKKNNIEYVLISPEERNYMIQNNLILNDTFFEKYPKIAEIGEFKVYKVK
ncbi:MAG: hypothetical protein K1X72_22210 [Pyrinomonadaceae bacterium]|nr:hypothetical protein [Pyrinomonadaceae bacterium]